MADTVTLTDDELETTFAAGSPDLARDGDAADAAAARDGDAADA